MIRKTREGYKVIGHKSKKSFGTYPSLGKAEARLKQLMRFRKNIGKMSKL